MDQPKYTIKIDSYSFGVLTLHVFSGKWPFPTSAFQPNPKVEGDVIPLREVGFKGRVVSDDLCMAGAGNAGGMPDRIRSAVAAGCDLVLVCHEWDREESEGRLPAHGGANPWLELRPCAAQPDEARLRAARKRVESL